MIMRSFAVIAAVWIKLLARAARFMAAIASVGRCTWSRSFFALANWEHDAGFFRRSDIATTLIQSHLLIAILVLWNDDFWTISFAAGLPRTTFWVFDPFAFVAFFTLLFAFGRRRRRFFRWNFLFTGKFVASARIHD